MNNKALLVGINQYPNSLNNLKGCINDVENMENFICDRNKVYPSQNIKKLYDKEATKKNIIEQLNWLIEDVRPGDQILFQYSGHGAQLPTMNSAEEIDGLDEIICPYDFNGVSHTTIRDKEFAKLFSRIPQGVHFVWISDSCHAENLSREPLFCRDVMFRNYGRIQTLSANATPKKVIASEHKPFNGALLSACSSHQLSADAFIENDYRGAFTHYLLKNLQGGHLKLPMSKLIQHVNTDLAKSYFEQNPQTEGTLQHATFFI